MAEIYWKYQNFGGGEATDKKIGIEASFANSQSLDFRKSPSQLSVLPGTERGDQNSVIDLIQNEVMAQSGDIYAIGSSGSVYSVSPTNVWSSMGSIGNGTFGISYRRDQDSIYITGTTTVSVITDVSTDPTLDIDFYNQSQSTYDNSDEMGFNVNSDQSGGTQNISVTADDTTRRYFQTDIQPIKRLAVDVVTVGTGTWTMTIYDGIGTVLGTATLTSGNRNLGWNYFTFTPIQVNVGPNNAQTYNFSLTSSGSNGVVSGTNTTLEECDMELWADRMVQTTNGMHPMVTFQQFECIGNGRYLSVWEPLGEPEPSNSTWQRQRLTFPPGYEVCGLAVFNEYLVIATERVSTTGTPQEGAIFYWDGLSDTYNYFTKIPEGSPESIHEYENVVWYVAAGTWYAITSVAATPTKIRRLPGSENVYTASNTPTKIYPYGATVRYGIHLIGWPSTTANESLPYGVYSWGRPDDTQHNAFGYSYVLSTGSRFKTSTNNLTIGMVKNWGNILHISWRDGDTYGVDVVDSNSAPASFSYWESLIFDNGYVTKQKLASNITIKWLPVQDGVRFRIKYSIDRGDWVYSQYFSNDNPYQLQPNFARFDIGTSDSGARFYEIQVGIEIYCDETVTEPPIVVGATLVFDDLRTESQI